MTGWPLHCQVRDDEIIVTLPGTTYTVTYYKPVRSPQLLARLISDVEDKRVPLKLSEFLRYALRHGEKEKTKLAEEINNIDLYLEIERIRFGEKLVFVKEISEECDKGLIPNMILQPLFENAVKHGVYESTEPINIKMTCEGLPSGMQIEISNNFDTNQVTRKGAGIGLKNVRNRLKLIYGRDDLVRVDTGEDVFMVRLIIPQSKFPPKTG